MRCPISLKSATLWGENSCEVAIIWPARIFQPSIFWGKQAVSVMEGNKKVLYLEDLGGSSQDHRKQLFTMVIVFVPKDQLGLWDPFQMGPNTCLVNGGVILTACTYKSWDDPPN